MAEGSKEKPRTSSLFKTMDPESISLDDALRLLSLPRVVGSDPGSGEEITAQNGRYGPYLRKGSDSRSLDDEEQIFSVTVEEALRIYAEPKRGRAAGHGAAQGAGRGPGVQEAGGGEGRTVRPLRDRRRGERVAAPRRQRRDHHDRAGGRAAAGPARPRPAKKKKSAAKKATKKKAAKKKAPAKKAAAKKS